VFDTIPGTGSISLIQTPQFSLPGISRRVITKMQLANSS